MYKFGATIGVIFPCGGEWDGGFSLSTWLMSYIIIAMMIYILPSHFRFAAGGTENE